MFLLKNLISQKFIELKEKNNIALIGFITLGYPDFNTTLEIAKTLEDGGVDLLELGVPFSDPVADGPIIQEASQIALNNKFTLDVGFKIISKIKKQTKIPLIIMTYYNPVFVFGTENFIKKINSLEVSGIIISDYPLAKIKEINKLCYNNNISFIPLIAPTSNLNIIQNLNKNNCANGFIYCISRTGITGVSKNLNTQIKEFLKNIKEKTKLPLAVGFGISKPQHIKTLKNYCEGVVVGSAFIKIIAANLKNKKLMLNKLKSFTQQLKNATKIIPNS